MARLVAEARIAANPADIDNRAASVAMAVRDSLRQEQIIGTPDMTRFQEQWQAWALALEGD